MTIFSNEPLVERYRKRGVRLSMAGLAVLVVSFIVVWMPAYAIWSWLLLLVGVGIATAGTYYVNRWVRPPLPLKVIGEAFEKTSARYVLFNHATAIPHLLLMPKGLLAIKVKRYEGPVRYDEANGQWKGKFSFRRFYTQGLTAETLGNPSEEVRALVETVETWLKKEAPEIAERVPVEGLALFLAPKGELPLETSPVPLATPETLREQALSLFRQHRPLPRRVYKELRETLEASLPTGVVEVSD